jgi:xanthine/CO dehydrogenase XdhC/CoxF family maturation factor
VFIAGKGGKPYDEEALYLALRADARYVGLLVSRQNATQAFRSISETPARPY